MDQRDRERAESVVKKLAQVVNVHSAEIDDYKIHRESDYIDFQAVVNLKLHRSGQNYFPDERASEFNLRKTSNQIKKILTEDSNVMRFGKAIDCPIRVYTWNGYKSEFDGYEKDYIMVDFMMAI